MSPVGFGRDMATITPISFHSLLLSLSLSSSTTAEETSLISPASLCSRPLARYFKSSELSRFKEANNYFSCKLSFLFMTIMVQSSPASFVYASLGLSVPKKRTLLDSAPNGAVAAGSLTLGGGFLLVGVSRAFDGPSSLPQGRQQRRCHFYLSLNAALSYTLRFIFPITVVALMSMKSMMRDETGVMGGWDINSVDPCTWTMVGCSPNGLVISLDMANNGLSGMLSSSVGNLSHLQTMLLQNNKITGPLPVEVGKLSQLKTLDLSDNQFAGQIPGSLGLLTHLGYLRLDRNNFSGPIPEAVAQLAGLTFLDLSFNNLSGPIPMISAKDYSVAGNYFLCNSSATRGCANGSVLVNVSITSGKSSNHHLAVAVSLSVICVLILFVLMLFCWIHRCQWRLPFASADKKYEFGMGQLKRFSFRELQVATDNFSSKNILGQGGFGVVYKGVLRNGSVVAVKRLKDPNFTGEVQFQTEVEMIGLALHRNVLCLYGFCMTSNDRLLIYPYMPNGSVADRLRDHNHGGPSLDWNKRMRIALGAARGLLYLHEQCNPRIIHRDVKAANILLDENYEAVVGDFGLAKLLDRRDSHVTTAVRGTVGHIAPEYLSTGQSSEKTDVFGFGVLLLEMITGQKTLCSGNGNTQKGVILEWVRELYEEKRLHSMVDRQLNGFFNAAELENAVEVILLCTQSNPSIRPKMCEVVKALEKARPAEQQVEESHEVLHGTSCSLSRFHDDINEASSFVIEPIELSGPR